MMRKSQISVCHLTVPDRRTDVFQMRQERAGYVLMKLLKAKTAYSGGAEIQNSKNCENLQLEKSELRIRGLE